jgi:hypothetical protein
MPGGASSSKQDAERPYFVSCTLCGKHQLDVEKLIHASPNIYVCMPCIDVMHATVLHIRGNSMRWAFKARALLAIVDGVICNPSRH